MRAITLSIFVLLSCSPHFAQSPEVSNFRPKTGLGLFDAELTKGRLDVKLSVFYSFQDGDPDTVQGFSAEAYRWNDDKKDEFKRKFAQQINEAWSQTYDLEHPGPPVQRVEVFVQVEEATSIEKAHWLVRISMYPDESAVPVASVCDPQYAHHGDDCLSFGTEFTWGTVSLSWPDRNLAGDFGNGIDPVTYHYRPRETKLPKDLLGQYPARLAIQRNWAARIDAWADWNEVSGMTSTGEDPSIVVARKRAETVQDALEEAGAAAPVQVVVHGAFPEEASRAVTLTVSKEPGVSTLAHEAGHMLGLEDEAESGSCTGGESIGLHYASAIQFYEFDRLYRTDSDSLMSRGPLVYCRHYVPFLNVLEDLTGRKSGWSFEKGSAHHGSEPVCPEH